MLRIEQLSKTFPGQVALADVSLDVEAGEVHALVGQNGSGKSTLIKVLAGYHQPDPDGARAWVNGSPLTLGDGAAAAAAGIRFVHQDLGLVGSMSAAENLALTAGYLTGRGGRIRWRHEVTRAREALAGMGLTDVDVRAPVLTLPPAQRTAVAIARALVGWENGATLLVLDEPTATLPGDDVERLFAVIHRLKQRGLSILYVSHHLDEVFELADRVTVLRDGQRVTTVPVGELDHMALVELIVGHSVETTTATDTVDDTHRAARGSQAARRLGARHRHRCRCGRDRRPRRHHRLGPRARARPDRRARSRVTRVTCHSTAHRSPTTSRSRRSTPVSPSSLPNARFAALWGR